MIPKILLLLPVCCKYKQGGGGQHSVFGGVVERDQNLSNRTLLLVTCKIFPIYNILSASPGLDINPFLCFKISSSSWTSSS